MAAEAKDAPTPTIATIPLPTLSQPMTDTLAKILVADDEPDLRALLQRYLSDQGYTVRTRMLGAHTGPQGVYGVQGRLAFGDFVLLPAERRLEKVGADIPLTTGEFALLLALAQNPQRPLGRDRLMALAYGPEHTATDRSIDVQIMRLRKLIEADPAQPRHIRTVWGVGYVFVPDGAAP
eukprot:gene13734-13517_t